MLISQRREPKRSCSKGAMLLAPLRKVCAKLGLCKYPKKLADQDSPRPKDHALEHSPTTPDHEEEKWGPLRDISDAAFVRLALKYRNRFQDTMPFQERDCTVLEKREGHNNLANIVRYPDGTKVCIRVPACGWGGKWTKHDAILLRRTALTMRYIKRNTNLLLPEVYAYDSTFENEIGAPYTLMSVIEGRPVNEAWFDDTPTLPLEEKRQNILRTLANTVSELRPLEFSLIGMLEFEDDETLGKSAFLMLEAGDTQRVLSYPSAKPNIGPSYQFNFGGQRNQDFTLNGPEILPAFETSKAWLKTQLQDWINIWSGRPDVDETTLWELNGIAMLYFLIIDHLPVSGDPASGWSAVKRDDEEQIHVRPLVERATKETFVIAPPDYDHQNIMCDEYGNVTGIIDWDRVETVPRFLGWAITPEFLNEDWTSMLYKWPYPETLNPFQLEGYRSDYAKYMKEACDKGEMTTEDWRFTPKSHLYSAVQQALGSMQGMTQVIYKILDVVLPRVQKYEYVCSLGEEGWREGEEELLSIGLKSLFSVTG